MIIGLILWNKLPSEIPSHFNFAGEADGYSSRTFIVFGFPLIMLAVHVLCAFFTTQDPNSANISKKMFSIVLWTCPAVSLIIAVVMYSPALGYSINPTFLSMIFVSLLFIVLGNLLPKCRHNYTIGIKLPWTIADEDNWNRTHRMAGPLWIAGGVLTLVNSFVRFHTETVFLAIMIIVTIVPTVYSYLLFRRKSRA